jgi:hypothetical protein
MNNSVRSKIAPILSFVLLYLTLVFASTGSPVMQAQPLAQAATLPEDTRLPYEREKFYTGGPHTGGICQRVKIRNASGIDFAGSRFEVLAIADGEYLGRGETTGSGLQAGRYVLIQHSTGIQSMYWHLDSFSPEILALTPGQSIPRGFPIGWSGQSGNQPARHLHLELRSGARADDPYSGQPVSWDGQTIDGWTIRMFRWPGDPNDDGISYRGSVVQGASRTQSIENVNGCGQTKADAIVSTTYPINATTASNDLDPDNTGFANFTDAPTCQAVDCKALTLSNTRNTNLPTPGDRTTEGAIDLFILVDLSRSFADDLSNFQAQARGIISALKASNADTRVGLARFEDYPIPPFGSAGDKAYERRWISLLIQTLY